MEGGGSHCVKEKVFTSFRHLNIVGCLHKKGLQRKGVITAIPGPLSSSDTLGPALIE